MASSTTPSAPTAPGFTLIEVMLVLAILSIIATLAVPNLSALAQHYRGVEDARLILAAITEGRVASQRENVPAEITILENAVEVRVATLNPTDPVDAARRRVMSFDNPRTYTFKGRVTVVDLTTRNTEGVLSTTSAAPGTAKIRFCPSGESYFRFNAGDGLVCALGDLTSASAKINFMENDEPFHVRINGALGSIDLKQGP